MDVRLFLALKSTFDDSLDEVAGVDYKFLGNLELFANVRRTAVDSIDIALHHPGRISFGNPSDGATNPE
jgi:hypothetical protein